MIGQENMDRTKKKVWGKVNNYCSLHKTYYKYIMSGEGKRRTFKES